VDSSICSSVSSARDQF